MTTEFSVEMFAENLRQDVLAYAEDEEHESMLGDSFTQVAFDILSESGDFEDPYVCYHRATGMEISGYDIDEDEGRLDLFLSIHTQSIPPETVNRQKIDVAFRRLRGFFDWCQKGRYFDLEESSPVFDLATHIHNVSKDLTKIRLIVITDGRTTVDTLPQESYGDLTISKTLWDVVRLHRVSMSGRERGALTIDLVKDFGGPVPCLEVHSNQQGYRAFLALFPGTVLRDIYAEHGPRLLERNVRSFLQARGKVNRQIRDTISETPERFLAYNNGITVTAESVSLSDDGSGGISKIGGMQIVNGGQTTASLLATEKGKADLSEVFIAAKLIEIGSGDEHEELVRNVSRYANSQNKVAEADFSANDPFHVKLEELSRTIWAPAVGETQKQTRWFYERARGQYQDARSSERTPARMRVFSAENPTAQRFTKTDLAKYENSWDQVPHMVSRGAQKNFSDYMIRLGERDQFVVDQNHFERSVAKAILFKTTEQIVRRQAFGGYGSNIVTYSIAKLANATSQRIDLGKVWREQGLSQDIQGVIAEISHEVHQIITSPEDGREIREWCKIERCWELVRKFETKAGIEQLSLSLMNADSVRRDNRRAISEISPEYIEYVKQVVEVSPQGWTYLATWGSETKAFTSSERQLALKIGKALRSGKQISAEDAEIGAGMIVHAKELGYQAVAE